MDTFLSRFTHNFTLISLDPNIFNKWLSYVNQYDNPKNWIHDIHPNQITWK